MDVKEETVSDDLSSTPSRPVKQQKRKSSTESHSIKQELLVSEETNSPIDAAGDGSAKKRKKSVKLEPEDDTPRKSKKSKSSKKNKS